MQGFFYYHKLAQNGAGGNNHIVCRLKNLF